MGLYGLITMAKEDAQSIITKLMIKGLIIICVIVGLVFSFKVKAYNGSAETYNWHLVLHIYLEGNPNPMLKWSNESSTIKYECEKQKLTDEFADMVNGLLKHKKVYDVDAKCVGLPEEKTI